MQETHEIQVPSLGQEDASGVGNGNLLQYSCQENPTDRGAWSVVHGITKKLDLTERLSTHMCHKGQPSNSGSPYMCSLSWLFASLQMKPEMKSMSIHFKEVLLSLSNMFWGSITWKGIFWMGQSVSSVAQWCLTLCNPMDCSTPGFPVHHQLPDAMQTHVHWVGDAIQPSHPLSSPSPPGFNLP